jgi:hypothetical protein
VYSQKKIAADLLFGVQFVCTIVFGGSQFLRMLTTSEGVSISWYGTWEVFLILNLILALRSHHNQSSRVTRQTILSYTLWIVVVTLDLGLMIVSGTGRWNERDTTTTIFAAIGVTMVLTVANRRQLPIADPLVKGNLAIFFKAVPQLILAYNMLTVGGDGLAALAVITGHVTILTRLGQLWFSVREAGWDRNRIGSVIAEISNEFSWMLVTIVWITR